MEQEELVLTVIAACTSTLLLEQIASKKKQKTKKRKRKILVKNWLLRRGQFGASNALIAEFRQENPENYKSYLRMDAATFQVIILLLYLWTSMDNFATIETSQLFYNKKFITWFLQANLL